MTLGGWVFMLATWGVILWLTVYSYRKILVKKEGVETDKRRGVK